MGNESKIEALLEMARKHRKPDPDPDVGELGTGQVTHRPTHQVPEGLAGKKTNNFWTR